MPEAESFNALGVGNGFPFCPAKVDVSGFDFWTTLSGVNKDSPTTSDALISKSLVNAMKLFWNIDGYVTGECTSTFDFGDGEMTAEVTFPVGSADATSGSLREPIERVCIVEPANEEYQVEDESTDNVVALVVCGAPKITRMYNGVTTDEDNFVGYGIAGGSIAESTFYMSAGELEDTSVLLLSYMDEFSATDTEYAYTEMPPISPSPNGMHFVCEVYHEEAVSISDPANRLILVDAGNIVTSIEIGAFAFYTYA